MSTAFYTSPDKKPIGERMSLGKERGYYFTWQILPLEFVAFALQEAPSIVDEHGNTMDYATFVEMVRNASDQGFEQSI